MNAITDRDLQILHFIAKFGYCLERHIAILLHLSLVQTSRIINRLIAARYIDKTKVLSGVGNYLFLTKESGKLLDVSIVSYPNLNTLNHDTLLIDLYFYLLRPIYKGKINTDKEIRRDFGIFKENTQSRVPDLLIDEHIAIELELSEKPKFRLQEIINTYIIDDNIQLVCYFLQQKSLLKKIYDLTLGHPKFKFYLFDFDQTNHIFNQISIYQNDELVLVNTDQLFELPKPVVKRYGNFEFK